MRNHKAVKAILAMALVLVSLLTMIPAAFADSFPGNNPQNPYENDEEYIQDVEALRKRVEDYFAEKNDTRTPGVLVVLDVPLYQQTNSYYCGPASVQMVVKYCTGTFYSQSTLASSMGTNSTNGTYVYKITQELNSRIGAGAYQHVTTSSYAFSLGLKYSIQHDRPIICHVMTGTLPNYSGGSNSGHYLVGTGYHIATYPTVSYNDCYYNDPHYNNAYYGSHMCTIPTMKGAIDANAHYYIMTNI